MHPAHSKHDGQNFPTHGFVEVGEEKIDGKYNIVKKSTSRNGNNAFDPNTQGVEVLFALYKTIAKDLLNLEEEVRTLKKHHGKQNGTWDQRYSKRLAVGGNLVLAMWVFSVHFLKTVRGQGKVRSKVFELLRVCSWVLDGNRGTNISVV